MTELENAVCYVIALCLICSVAFLVVGGAIFGGSWLLMKANEFQQSLRPTYTLCALGSREGTLIRVSCESGDVILDAGDRAPLLKEGDILQIYCDYTCTMGNEIIQKADNLTDDQ